MNPPNMPANAVESPCATILSYDVVLSERLRALAEARKETHWIQSDLSVSPSTRWGRLLWCIAQFFDCLRTRFYHIDLNLSTQSLRQLRPLVKDKDPEIQLLFQKAVQNYNEIVSESYRIEEEQPQEAPNMDGPANESPEALEPIEQSQLVLDCEGGGNSILICKKSDITKEEVYVIVNAANENLLKSGGVDDAIHKAGGAEIAKACQEIREKRKAQGKIPPCPAGEAVVTIAGDLPAKYVVHAVGPMYVITSSNKAPIILKNAYENSLELAYEAWKNDDAPDKKPLTIAFPSISTGIFGYPVEEAAPVALKAVRKWLRNHPGTEVRFLFWGPTKDKDYQAYCDALK